MITSSSCHADGERRANPLLERSWDTPYGIAPLDKIQASDYPPAFEQAFSEQNRVIETIKVDTLCATFDNTILALDNSDIAIADIFNIFSMVEAANSTSDMARVSRDVMPRLSAQRDYVLLDTLLFKRVKEFYDIRHISNLNAEQLRLTEKTYDKFVRAGALLDEVSRRELRAINEEIAELRVQFSQNLMAESNTTYFPLTRQQLEGLPNSFREIALLQAEELGIKNRWVVTLKPSSLIPFLSQSRRRAVREEVFKAYINRGRESNELIVKRATELRLARAKLLGYENHAEYVTSAEMAGSAKAAYDLLDGIWTSALESAHDELSRMKRFFLRDNPNEEFEAWDWWLYAEEVRSQDYSLKAETLRAYFSVEGVRNGAFLLANRLYGLTFRPIKTPQYDEYCTSFEVIDIDGEKLGLLHMDLYTRPTKGQGAWCGFLREQRYDEGQRLLPIVSISCNFALPKQGGKSLLSMDETQTLFHEFGHALHFLFQDVEYRGLSSVEGDFVELPSQIMERWVFEPEFLRLYAFHATSGAVIPENLVNSISKASSFNQGFERVEKSAAAYLDLDLHTLDDLELFDVDIFETKSLHTKRGIITQIEPRYHLYNFSHLFTFDYASGYYFYQWAEELERRIFEEFKLSGDLFNRELALKFRREILSRGGQDSGEVMYQNFMGKK